MIEKISNVCTSTVIKVATIIGSLILVLCALIRFSYLTGESEEETALIKK
jgi:hypothetical protein